MRAARPRRWARINIALPDDWHDPLIGLLAMYGFAGFEQHKISIDCYLDTLRWDARTKQAFQSLLTRFAHECSLPTIMWKARVFRETNWNRRWEAQAGIVEATPDIVIKPSWRKLRKKDRGKIVLHIDPKMSFGTGHHETTRLCLSLLEKYLIPGTTVIDLGTGTGVLAIAAAKLGARRVLALDNDPWCYENASENVRRNRVRDLVSVRQANVEKLGRHRFDLVVANIDLKTFSRCHRQLTAATRSGGTLILSGILSVDRKKLLALMPKSFRLLESRSEREWMAFAFHKL